MKAVDLIVEALSAEWILRWRPNGGTAILLRSLWVSTFIFGFYLGLRNWLDPHRLWWTFSLDELRQQLSGSLRAVGTIFAAVYAALYTRFASQWNYLASVYNQIKATESRGGCVVSDVSLWKAGFIEDADELHLANKHHFASTIRAWGREAEVAAAFAQFAPGGSGRLTALLERADAAYLRHGQRYAQGNAHAALQELKVTIDSPPSSSPE